MWLLSYKFSKFFVPIQHPWNGLFLGPNSPKYYQILWKLSPYVVLKERKTVYLEFLQKKIFLGKREIPKVCTFGPTLTPSFPLKMAKIEKTKYLKEKIQSLGYPNNGKSKPYLFSIVQDFMISFCSILAIFCQKAAWSHVKGPKSKFDLTYSAVSQFWCMFQWKNFGSSTFQFCGYR